VNKMEYSYKGKDDELSLDDLNKSFAWPNAQIGEEMARVNGFVNDKHSGSSNDELTEEELDSIRADVYSFSKEEDSISRRSRR